MAENKNKTLKDARKEMNYLTGDAEVRRLAELREKWEMDRINAISYATKVGKEQGVKEGIIETAREMLKEKIPEETIKKVTKLSQVELDEIKKKIKN